MTGNAQDRGWGNPGPPGSQIETTYKLNHTEIITVGGIRLRVRSEVAPLFKAFIQALLRRNYRLDVNADDWGYANRDVRGRPGVKSNHAWGLAVDLNATTNPMTNDGRTHTDLPSDISSLARRYHLRWGGDYTGTRKDPMHFEYMGTPTQAQQDCRSILPVKAPTPTPAIIEPKPVTEINMLMAKHPDGQSWWILSGTHRRQIRSTPDHKAYTAAGVKAVTISSAEFNSYADVATRP